MFTAFQDDAFQVDAFQINTGAPVLVFHDNEPITGTQWDAIAGSPHWDAMSGTAWPKVGS